MTEWRSPGVLVGIAAILVAVVLFVADQLVPDEQFAEGFRDALGVAGQVAPWAIAAVLAVVVVYLLRERDRLRKDAEKMRKLEAALKKAKQTPSGASPGEAPVKPTRQNWASTSKSGIVRLTLPNSQLEAMYERAVAALRERGLDGRLVWLEVWVYPYASYGPNHVSMALSFYSDRSRREYTFWMEDDGEFREDEIPRLRALPAAMFRELPWREQSEWCEMLNLVAERVGPLVRHGSANLTIYTGPPSPPLQWTVSVDDSGAGRWSTFKGTSAVDMQEQVY